ERMVVAGTCGWRQRVADVLEGDAAAPATNLAHPGRAAFWHVHGRHRRVSHHGRTQPFAADVYVDSIYVAHRLPDRRLVPGIRGGGWMDRCGGDARRGSLSLLHLPQSGLGGLRWS